MLSDKILEELLSLPPEPAHRQVNSEIVITRILPRLKFMLEEEHPITSQSEDNRCYFWRHLFIDLRMAVNNSTGESVDGAISLLYRKNKAYGSEPLLATGETGVIIRMIDKVYRIKNLKNNPGIDDLHEAAEDTLVDLFNYSVLGYLLARGGIT